MTYNYGTTGMVIKRQSTNNCNPEVEQHRGCSVPRAWPTRAPTLQRESCSYSQGGTFRRKPGAEEGVVCQVVMRCKEEPVTSSTKGW